MTITVHQVPNAGIITISVTGESMKAFKELVQRATNLWPDAPPEIKEFADLVTNNGTVLQNYWAQANVRNPNEPSNM